MWRHFLFTGRDRCHLFHEKWRRKKGHSLCLIKNENIRIIAMKDTIHAIYNIDNGILTLTTFEKVKDVKDLMVL